MIGKWIIETAEGDSVIMNEQDCWWLKWVMTKMKLCVENVWTGKAQTERQAEVGPEPRWIPLQEAVTIFFKHQDYAHDEMKRGAYLQEYKAMLAYLKAVKETKNG